MDKMWTRWTERDGKTDGRRDPGKVGRCEGSDQSETWQYWKRDRAKFDVLDEVELVCVHCLYCSLWSMDSVEVEIFAFILHYLDIFIFIFLVFYFILFVFVSTTTSMYTMLCLPAVLILPTRLSPTLHAGSPGLEGSRSWP